MKNNLKVWKKNLGYEIVPFGYEKNQIFAKTKISYPRVKRECCLLVLNLVSSTLSCIRQPRPRLEPLSLLPPSVVTLVLSSTYCDLYGTSFFPTRVSSVRGTRLAPVSSDSGIHAESRSHVRREPRHVPILPVIPGGEHSLTPGTILH